MHVVTRVVLVVALLALVVGMGVHYDVSESRHWSYPTQAELGADFDGYVGQDVFVIEDVETVPGPDTAMVTVGDGQTTEVTVTGVEPTVEPGTVVQIYGTVRPGQEIAATQVVVVQPAGSDGTYKYAVSAVGAVVILVTFFRYWRVNLDEFTLEGRDG